MTEKYRIVSAMILIQFCHTLFLQRALPSLSLTQALFNVELHHRLFPGPIPSRIDLERFIGRAQPAAIAGVEARVFCPADARFNLIGGDSNGWV